MSVGIEGPAANMEGCGAKAVVMVNVWTTAVRGEGGREGEMR